MEKKLTRKLDKRKEGRECLRAKEEDEEEGEEEDKEREEEEDRGRR